MWARYTYTPVEKVISPPHTLGARLSGVYNRPIIVLVMARVRQNGKSSLINSVISHLPPQARTPFDEVSGQLGQDELATG